LGRSPAAAQDEQTCAKKLRQAETTQPRRAEMRIAVRNTNVRNPDCLWRGPAGISVAMLSDQTTPARPRYRWPWFLLAGVLLGIALAVIWLSAEVRRVKERRQPEFAPPIRSGATGYDFARPATAFACCKAGTRQPDPWIPPQRCERKGDTRPRGPAAPRTV
jgi:hypothetical protein